jgi:RHH-type transcriptional regulator, proline utilization regulon repressor / proline dehydrogenase / delta 1-pyrroline-5-carboxylate dehydrogenase
LTKLDREVTALARRIAELGADEQARVFNMSWWSERMLDWAMSHPDFKTRLFHFVDVFPATRGDEDVVRHMEDYFSGVETPPPLKLGMEVTDRLPFGKAVSAQVARRNIRRMARQFIVGESPRDAVQSLHRLWRQGSGFTVDLLGEKVLTSAEADRYAQRVEQMLREIWADSRGWAPDDHLERDDLGPIARINLSVKPTALSPLFAPLTEEEGLEQAKDRLRPVLRSAAELGAFINLDVEHYEVKDLTLELFTALWDEPEFQEFEAGVVVQAYLKDAARDLSRLIDWSANRKRPITIRVVKGAYWDTETVVSRAEGWPSVVFDRKAETDRNYERCVRMLHENHGKVRAAFGTHNLRSLAYAIVSARDLGVPEHGYELQMLYGMAEPIQAAIRRLGLRLRIYAPVGELIPGMAYLVRRLLENTSNESFIRHRFAEGRALDELLRPPAEADLPGLQAPVRRPETLAAAPGPYLPEPVSEWRRAGVRSAFESAIVRRVGDLGMHVPAVIGNREIQTSQTILSIDPADPHTQVARSAACGAREGDLALEAAFAALRRWSRTPADMRASVLFKAAEWMRSRRNDLAALEVFEASKPWKEADGDVCEAIDFCEYYGREMLKLDRGGRVQSPPGELNALKYSPRGVGVVIAPWNFPLAIPMGMTAAALVAGNCVLLKPAEQTPAVAWQIIQAFRWAGLPEGVLNFLPGFGEDVGAYLVAHPDVAFIAFTGSKAVGLDIIASASRLGPSQRQVKRVVAEMGGKNAIVVDSDADLDVAVPGTIYSAFGYAGQKCSAASRLIVVDSLYEQMLDRLVGAGKEIVIGHPRRMGVMVGALIDREAHERVGSYIRMGAGEGTLALHRDDVPGHGYFAGPTIVTDLDRSSPLITEEIFGPVLSVLRAESFEQALELANETEYALTAGLYSRTRAHVEQATAELRAGNVYVNRPITGAVVGRQPFGGYGLSGVGSKAGGPDYLLQFLNPRTLTENTLRQGFAPSEVKGV